MVGSFKRKTPPSSTGWRVNLDTEQKAGPALYELGNADEPRKIDYGDIRFLGPFCKISIKSRGSTGVRCRMLRDYFVTVLLGRLRYKGLGNCRSDIRGSAGPVAKFFRPVCELREKTARPNFWL